jgi:hypothetical protein
MRLKDHVTLNLNKNMSTAAVYLVIEKAFDTTWNPGLLYKFSKLEFSSGIIKLISSFLSNRKFRFSVEGEMSAPREIQAGAPQGSVLSPTLYSIYKRRPPRAQVFTQPSLLIIRVYTSQTAKRAMFSESCSAVSLQWDCGASTGTSKSMRTRLRRSTSLAGIEPLRRVLH